MTGNPRGNARGSRGAFGANIVIAVALIALVAAVALVVKPPSPPGTAEFAPEAAKAITKAPQQQAGAFGASGACSAGSTCTGTQKKAAAARAHAAAVAQAAKKAAVASATSTTYTGVPPQLQCVQWPDGAVTQDFDPQSPPCVSDWPGQAKGNGGSTATGVTGSTITVAAESFYPTSDAGNAAIVNFFNSHFELYGRHFVLTYPNIGSDDTFTPTGQQAAAATYAASKPFASTDLVSTQGLDVEFLNYLAQAHIVTVAPTVQEPSSELASLSPYLYTYQPAVDQIESNLAAMICTSLPASGNAVYGGATVVTKKRKFAIIEPDSTTTGGFPDPEVSTLTSALSGCGVSASVSQYDQPSGAATVNTSQTELLANLEREGVTSVILFGSADDAALVMRSAADINYTPEWISSGVGDLAAEDADASFSENAPASESEHLIGMTPASKYLPYAEMPWSQAYADEGITTTVDYGYSDFYHEMLILASGVQAAGPDLTPQTFATGLRGLQFPNPGAAQAPSYQAKVDFGSGSTMTQDYAAWYYSTTTDSNATNNATYVGASCDINLGERWSLGSWPANLSFSGVGKSCY